VFVIDDAYIVCGAAPPAPSRLLVAQEKIQAIGWEDSVAVPEAGELIAVFGRRVVPGFVDMHIHGAGGASFMDADPDALAEICRYAARHGTTALLATLEPAPPDQLLKAVEAIAAFEGVPDGARIVGIHLEGPWLNKECAGAHNADYFRTPALDEFERLAKASRGLLKHVTMAPELPGAIGAIEYLRERNVTVGLGHSNADFRTARRAIAHGAITGTHVPHTLPPLHQRDLSVTTSLMTDDRVVAELIADGVHVHPAMVRLLVRSKRPSGVALVTNSVFAAGLPDGKYTRDGMPIVVEQGIPRRETRDGPLAGSNLTMSEAFANTVRFAGVSLYEASCMAAEVPARIIGEERRFGRIAAGMQADLVVLDHDESVWMTIVAGRIVYRAEQ
jgi:N-acetylglucosamine-6-phosphate deacetylase